MMVMGLHCSYKISLLKPSVKALMVSTRTSVRMDNRGFLSMQFMIRLEDGQICFAEYFVSHSRFRIIETDDTVASWWRWYTFVQIVRSHWAKVAPEIVSPSVPRVIFFVFLLFLFLYINLYSQAIQKNKQREKYNRQTEERETLCQNMDALNELYSLIFWFISCSGLPVCEGLGLLIAHCAHQPGWSTPSQDSTGMGDHLWVYNLDI